MQTFRVKGPQSNLIMKRLAIIIGTRPEAIKLLPVYLLAARRDDLVPILISTGQHREMLHDAIALFQCKLDIDLDLMQPNQSLAALTSKIFERLDPVLNGGVDVAMVQGDTTTAMIGATLAFYRGVPCAHVEAGLRSGNLQSPFPEEYNRRVISLSSRWHFAPTDLAAANLRHEGIVDNIHVVGNTSIDAAHMIARLQPEASARLRKALPLISGTTSRRLVLVTAHRRENFGEPLRQIIAAVASIASSNPDLDVVWPVHPNPNIRQIVYGLVPEAPNIFLTEPIRYDDLIYLMRRSYIILTDSGGIQEEAAAFNKPVIVLRDTTERPEGVKAGCSVLAGPNKDRILQHFNELLRSPEVYMRMCNARNPYGDGNASQRIVDAIMAAT